MPTADRTHLRIVPVGAIDELAIAVVAANLQALLGLNTDVGPTHPTPDDAYQHGRHQYDAGRIIDALAGRRGDVPLVLGITRNDLCTPILTFVFGESQLGGDAAVISLNRLADPQTEVICTRAAKIGLHEVGHLLGIGHCRSQECLMSFSATLEKLDRLNLWFCDACQVELSRRLRHRFGNL